MQVTASKTDQLLECQRPFDPRVPLDPDSGDDTARAYGIAFHVAMQHLQEMGGGEPPTHIGNEPYAAAHHAYYGVLLPWLSDNPFGIRFKIHSAERPLASKLYRNKGGSYWKVATRPCAFDAETHTYDLRPGEFGGTADLECLAKSGRKRLILDYKTGDRSEGFDRPASLPQLRTLALMTAATHVGVLWAPRNAPVVIFSEEITREELQRHASAMVAAMARVGDGSMRPGTWCSRCPARGTCPSQDAHLVDKATALTMAVLGSDTLVAPVDRGAFHMLLTELDRLSKRARELLREAVANGELIQRPDGKVLILREKTVETLSKASVLRALGPDKGEALIAELRRSGCVESDTRVELHAVKE